MISSLNEDINQEEKLSVDTLFNLKNGLLTPRAGRLLPRCVVTLATYPVEAHRQVCSE